MTVLELLLLQLFAECGVKNITRQKLTDFSKEARDFFYYESIFPYINENFINEFKAELTNEEKIKIKNIVVERFNLLMRTITYRSLKEDNVVGQFMSYYMTSGDKNYGNKQKMILNFLACSFIWGNTKEGFDFWSRLSNTISKKLVFILNQKLKIKL